MKKTWHILKRMVVIALAAVSFLMAAHAVACHSETEFSGHNDDGCSQTECVCVCACHAALEPSCNDDLCLVGRAFYISSDYVILLGTSVPCDIFRPPLARS